jgi:hypothetical protein
MPGTVFGLIELAGGIDGTTRGGSGIEMRAGGEA